jgi:hypothetical protein
MTSFVSLWRPLSPRTPVPLRGEGKGGVPPSPLPFHAPTSRLAPRSSAREAMLPSGGRKGDTAEPRGKVGRNETSETRHMRFRFLLCLIALIGGASAFADRLYILRGDTLSVNTPGAREGRKLATLPKASGTLFAATPDGHRMVWGVLASPSAEGDNLLTRPLTVTLSDQTGMRQKRLFVTNALKDRQGRIISEVGGVLAGGEVTRLSDWVAKSLTWSADSRTLYLSCVLAGEGDEGNGATFAIDAVSGAAIVDSNGRLKVITGLSAIDTRPGWLVGVRSLQKAGAGEKTYCSLYLSDLAKGEKKALPSKNSGVPEYENAASPTLSPNADQIVFTASSGGLWWVDVATEKLQRLIRGEVRSPRWRADGKTVFFLAPRPTVGNKPTYDLFELVLVKGTPQGAPRLAAENVDAYALVEN